jgi:hypothetical protein
VGVLEHDGRGDELQEIDLLSRGQSRT